MSKGTYKLTYFDGRGRAELSRLILAAADQKFEDERLTGEQWGARKAAAKFNILPNLTWNGKTYGQSLAIAQHLAREFGFYGKGNEEALRVDEATQGVVDIRTALYGFMFEKDEAKKAEGLKKAQESVPKLLKALDGLAVDNGKKGFFVGTKLSLADLILFDTWEGISKLFPEAEKTYPELAKIIGSVKANPALKKYLDARKPTQF